MKPMHCSEPPHPGLVSCLESPNTARMKISRQRILSMAFLIIALALFTAMHFLPLSPYNARGWVVWENMWWVIRNPMILLNPVQMVAWSSFITSTLLIAASPFLGNVWIKSLLAWSMVVVFSGVASAGFLLVIFKDVPPRLGLYPGLWCLMISPVLNFVGLLLARPQWLKKSGPSFPPESQAVN